jgi:hypothetical protein
MSDNPETPDSVLVTAGPRRKFHMGCLGYCVCLFLLLIVTWICIKVGTVRALNAEMDELRAAGEPVTWEEVIAGIAPIPDEENSALVLQPHLPSLSAWQNPAASSVVVTRSAPILGVRPSDEMTKLMRVCLTHGSAALKLLHTAADRPSGRWPVDPDPLVHYDSLGHLAAIRSSTRLLDVEVELRAADGDGHAAAQSVRAMRRLAASLDGSPDLIAALVRIAVDKMSAGAAEYALSLTELSATDLAMLRDEFAAEAEQLGFLSAARGERALWFWMATDGRHELIDELGGGNALVTFYSMLPGVVESDAMLVLDYMSSWVELLKLPPRDLQTGMALRSDKYDPILSNHIGRPARRSLALLSPSIWRGTGALLATKLRLHITCAALAVEQFRMERGDWPDKLADLVPDYLDAVPEDWSAPAGTPLTYTRTPAGVSVWLRGKGDTTGRTYEETRIMQKLVWEVSKFAEKVGRLPKSLNELLKSAEDTVPVDPVTGEPYTYVTNPASPELFIVGGFMAGMTEATFWKRSISATEWANQHGRMRPTVAFRLLNPELRGAAQSTFVEDVGQESTPEALHALGYSLERLKAFGFADDYMDYFRGEYEKMGPPKARSGAAPEPDAPDVPADTQAEARP